MTKKALVIGCGFLGSHILNELKNSGIFAVGTHINPIEKNMLKIDVTNINSIEGCVLKLNPDLIINCAANVNIDYLENNPDLAFSVNAYGTKNIALISKRKKIKLIHISTDGVFDGKRGNYSEQDIVNPINIYAKSKALAEKLVKEISDESIIVRTNFYGNDSNGKFLFNRILSTLRKGKQITGFADVIFTPLEVSNLGKMVSELAMINYNGIIHLASNEIMSKYQFALKIAENFGMGRNLVKKGSIDDLKLIAKRPKNTSLVNKKAKQLLKTPITTVEEWLKKICDEI